MIEFLQMIAEMKSRAFWRIVCVLTGKHRRLRMSLLRNHHHFKGWRCSQCGESLSKGYES